MRSEGLSRTAILAGSGQLPLDLAIELDRAGRKPLVLSVAGEADRNFGPIEFDTVPWGGFGTLFDRFRAEDVSEVVFAGAIQRRPALSDTKLDVPTLRSLPHLLMLVTMGDDSILSGVAGLFEDAGFRLRSAPDLVPGLLTGTGVQTQGKPGRRALDQIAVGRKVLLSLAPFDVGQGVVVCGRRIVAVEGVEGTDAMLERVATLRDTGRLADKRDGVLVKLAKRGQDLRMDLPTIGPDTVRNARLAGLRGIAADAANSLLLERERTLDLANRHRVFLTGIQPSDTE